MLVIILLESGKNIMKKTYRKDKFWYTETGKQIPFECLDDNHLDNILAMLERTAKNIAYEDKVENMSKKDKKVFDRELKMKRILNEPNYEIVWEPWLSDKYWDLVYEKRKRQNILFR